jgi:C4-dicarboxylate-specific signal transduction histidine kinase
MKLLITIFFFLAIPAFAIAQQDVWTFFTTKPTGEGTGLGLSLAYDIVKSHGGELKVETDDEKGAVFIIQISTCKTI